MIILTIRTDSPEAEIGIFDGQQKLAYETWHAHRELSSTLHKKIEELLINHGKAWNSLEAIIAFEGPGSFTGLRIGLSVANALASSLDIPIVAEQSDNWIQKGVERLIAGQQDEIALPFYGRDANITAPRK